MRAGDGAEHPARQHRAEAVECHIHPRRVGRRGILAHRAQAQAEIRPFDDEPDRTAAMKAK